MDAQQLMQQVRTAVGFAYGTSSQGGPQPDRAQRKEADRWLQEFQKSSEAWQVADALLGAADAPAAARFFAAQTLHAKLQYDFHELPAEAVGALRRSLLDHLKRAAAAGAARALVIRLCLAVGALAVQTNWGDFVGDLCREFPPGELGAAGGALLLELLVAAPEEAASRRALVAEGPRAAFRAQLRAAAPQVLGYLAHVRNQVTRSTDGYQKFNLGVLECFKTWVEYCEIPAETLCRCPVMNWAITSAIQDAYLFEATVDALVAVLRTYAIERREDMAPDKLALAQLLVPALMTQQEAYEVALRDGDDDTCRGLCRLFTEVAESYLHLLVAAAAPPPPGADPAQDLPQRVLAQMLRCTAHPEPEIAAITLNFWYRLVKALQVLPPEEKQPRLALYAGGFTQLAEVALGLLRLPEDYEGLSADQAEDRDRFRLDVGDALEDCAGAVGADAVLRLVAARLEAAAAAPPGNGHAGAGAGAEGVCGGGGWRDVEACLYALRSVSGSVLQDGPELTGREVVPAALAALPELAQRHRLVRRTANSLVGEYAKVLKARPELLRPLFDFLLAGLGEGADGEAASAAAGSLKAVMKRCGKLMGGALAQLAAELARARAAGALRAGAELDVLEGLCHVASGLEDPAAAAGALRALAQPLGDKLAEYASAGGETKDIKMELDRLTVVVRYTKLKIPSQMEHPTVELIQAVIPIFDGILNHIESNASAVESLCRCYKHAVRSTRKRSAPLLRPLGTQLLARFRRRPHAAYLYAASILVTELARTIFSQFKRPDLYLLPLADNSTDALHCVPDCFVTLHPEDEHIADLFQLCESFSIETFQQLQTFDQYTAMPDLVEEYFFFIARFLSYCPGPLLASPVVDTIVQGGIVGLQLRHREAQSGILTFFEELVSTGIETPHNKQAAEYMARLEPVLAARGAALVGGLVGAVAGALPAYALDDRDAGGSAAGVLWKLFHLSEPALRTWLVPAVNQISASVATVAEKEEFTTKLMNQADRDRFCDVCSSHRIIRSNNAMAAHPATKVIYDFARLCHQRSRKWHQR